MERKAEAVKSSNLQKYITEYAKVSAWDDLLMRSKQEAERGGVGFMSLSSEEVYLLKTAIEMMRPIDGNCKWVEVGALTGYTALSLLENLGPAGKIWTLEKDPNRGKFLEELFNDSRLGGRLKVVIGDSRETKQRLVADGPFEGIFIDGAKAQYMEDLKWAEANVIPGGLIVADNVFLRGDVFAQESGADLEMFSEKQVGIMREFLSRVSDSRLYKTILLPTSDGLSVSRKLF